MIKSKFIFDRKNLADLFFSSPIRLFFNILGLVFLIEWLIMFFIIREVNFALRMVDATILTLLLAPLLWRYIIRPIRSQALGERLWAYDVINNIVDGIITINEKGDIESFNPSAEKIFGYKSEEIVGQKINQLILQPYCDELDRYIHNHPDAKEQRIVGTGREVSGLMKDGSIISIYIGLSEMKLDDRRIFTGIIHDLTAEKQAKEELRKLSRALEQSPVSVIITNVMGNIEYVNPKFVEVTGYQPEEVLGKNPSILKSGLTPSQEYKMLWNTIIAGKEWRGEFQNRKKNGELFWEYASISPLRNEYDEITHFIGIKEDITERKKTEQALRSSEARNTALLDAIPDLMFRIGSDGIIKDYHAKNAVELFTAPEEFLNKHVNAILPKWLAEKTMEYIKKTLATGKLHLFEYEMPVNNQPRDYEARFAKGIEGEVTIIIRDITERKQAEMAMKKSQQAALEATQAKSRFLSNMSHELRTPLNSIIGFTNVILKKEGDIPINQVQTYLERIGANGKHLLLLINDVLDLSKIEAGRAELELTEVEFKPLIMDVITQLNVQDQNVNVQLVADIPQNLTPIKTDVGKLKQVLINLIGNAIKFTEVGSVTISVETNKKDYVPYKIHISDTGIGIPANALNTIFDSFQQVDSKSNRKYQGTGLGLSISKSLCEMMGYDLIVKSEEGKGSTFTIVIQYNREKSSSVSQKRKQRTAIRQKNDAAQTEVLEKIKGTAAYVVDPEADSRVLLNELMVSLGCKVTTSSTMNMRKINNLRPKIIIITTKKVSLVQKQITTLKAEKMTRNIPLIVVSTRSMELSTLLTGANEFIDKPVHRKSLMWAIARCILNGKNDPLMNKQSLSQINKTQDIYE